MGLVLLEKNREMLREKAFVVYLKLERELHLKQLNPKSRPLFAGVDKEERLSALAAQREPLYEAVSNVCYEVHYRGMPEALLCRLQEEGVAVPA